MKIVVSEHSGYCFGVRRATGILDALIARQGNERAPGTLYTLGPIIHNRQVTEQYDEKGVQVIEALHEIDAFESAQVVIRSHGAPKAIYDEAAEKGIALHDATCPYVKKIQNTVSSYAKKGYNIIIVGDRSHPEVIGINGWCNGEALIISGESELSSVSDVATPTCIVAQTTFSLEKWQHIARRLQERLEHAVVMNTICLATEQRQLACAQSASEVDLMIVVGGKHSSNTRKLAELCAERVQTLHIETKDELENVDFSEYSVIGITAGASTPDWIIESVILKIENEGEVLC